MVNLATAALGVDVFFGASRCTASPSCAPRTPGAGTSTTSRSRWRAEMGMPIVPPPPAAAARAYEDGKLQPASWSCPRRRHRLSMVGAGALRRAHERQLPRRLRHREEHVVPSAERRRSEGDEPPPPPSCAIGSTSSTARRGGTVQRHFPTPGRERWSPDHMKFRAELFAAGNAARRKAASPAPAGADRSRDALFLADYRAEHGRADR